MTMIHQAKNMWTSSDVVHVMGQRHGRPASYRRSFLCRHGPPVCVCGGSAANAVRSGVVLVLVVGIVSLIAVMFTVLLAWTRDDAALSNATSRQAQARIVLTSALLYIQESSRLGWGEEAYGWIDPRVDPTAPPMRTHELGARSFSDYGDDAIEASIGPRTAQLDGLASYRKVQDGGLSWPSPGATIRMEMNRYRQPPFAMRVGVQTPLVDSGGRFFPPSDGRSVYGSDNGFSADIMVPLRSIATRNDFTGGGPSAPPKLTGWERVLSGVYRSSLGALDAAPMADSLAAFAKGDKTIVAESVGRSWFRIYRETIAEHDGKTAVIYPDNAGGYGVNRLVAAGAGIFIVTCGAGGTRGYRTYEESPAGLFSDAQLFKQLREQEVILWYRVAWTPFAGGRLDMDARLRRVKGEGSTETGSRSSIYGMPWPMGFIGIPMFLDDAYGKVVPYGMTAEEVVTQPFGSFAFIAKLEREPPRW